MNYLIIDKQDNVTTILINRPHAKNAVDGLTAKELVEAFEVFEKDEDSFVAILGGTNGTFCSGADLKAIAGNGIPNELSENGNAPMGPSRMMLSKPVIAAISGHAVAGGLELACWCDLRVVEQSAIMGVFCRRWGVPLIDGGTIRLSRLIGMSRAMDLILTGRPIDSNEAFQMGLANRIVPNGTALEEAKKLAISLTRFPQNCMRSDRMSAYQQWDLSLADALKNEFRLGKKVIDSNETYNGAARFSSGKGRHGDFENI
jgi:enoyl-CoA hydratase